jgi:hypothetical protein
MFLIANTTNKQLSFSEFNFVLKPKQAVNLHKMEGKTDPEKSNEINEYIRLGYIKVLKRDAKEEFSPSEPIQQTQAIDQEQLVNSIKLALSDEIKQQIAAERGNNKDILAAIANIASLVNSKSNTNTIVIQKGENKTDQEDAGIDEETLAKIHTKAVKKITRGTESSVNNNNEEIVDLSIANNISELGDLLG